MKLIFLGKLSAMAQGREMMVPCPPEIGTLSDLRAWVAASMPDLGEALTGRQVATIVNMAVVHDPQHPVTDADEIAFLPPMSGG